MAQLYAVFMNGGAGSGGTAVPTERTSGLPTSSNGASSFHLWWDTAGAATEYSATLEVLSTPTEARIAFWALGCSFVNISPTVSGVGGAHTGLQWMPLHPNSRAINWGGYLTATGAELPGTLSSLPSAPNNPNTRDFNWIAGRKYRFRVFSPAANTWRATVTDLATSTTTTIRDLTCNATHLGNPVVWTEAFTDCGTTSYHCRWTDLTAVINAVPVDATSVYLSYQSVEDGGCSNTNSFSDGTGIVQRVNTARTNPEGTILTVP